MVAILGSVEQVVGDPSGSHVQHTRVAVQYVHCERHAQCYGDVVASATSHVHDVLPQKLYDLLQFMRILHGGRGVCVRNVSMLRLNHYITLAFEGVISHK